MRHEYLKLVPENISVTFTDIHFSKRTGESITVQQRDVASNVRDSIYEDFNDSPRSDAKISSTCFEVHGYKIFSRSNENNEPVHVHVAKGKQSADATKIWLPLAALE